MTSRIRREDTAAERRDLRAQGLSQFDEGAPPEAPSPFNIASYCLSPPDTPPEKIALQVYHALDAEPESWSYAALREAIARAAGGLIDAGLGRGERVLLRLAPTARFPMLYLGAMAAGGVAMPLSLGLSAREVAGIAADARPRFACLEPGDPATEALRAAGVTLLDAAAIAAVLRAEPRPPLLLDPESPALLIYTSGSSGRPKGVLHAHRSIIARRMMWRDWYDIRPEDRLLHAGALNWTYTLGAGMTDPWSVGATSIVWQGEAEPTLWPSLAARAEPTLFAATPAHYRRILKYGQDLRQSFASVRHGFSAGEELPPGFIESWEKTVGFRLHEALGMSECSTYLSSCPDRPAPPGCSGRPQRGRRIAILPVEDGETPIPLGEVGMIAIDRRDPGLMLGYLNDPTATEAVMRGRWFLTGDLGAMSDEGWVRYAGRADDQMNAMGFRVAPQEVEAALGDTPGLAEGAAATTTVADGVALIVFYAVPAEDADPDTLRAALAARAEERLATYKRPREIVIVDDLPRSSNGKIKRKALGEIGAALLATG